MKLTVLGATGGTGRSVVSQALDAGHAVTAVVRGRDALGLTHKALREVVADVFDATSLESAVAGSDAVLSALGPRGRRDTSAVCSTAVRNVVEVMRRTGTTRIVAVSAQPVLRSGAGEPLWFRATTRPLVRALYRTVYADLERMEEVLRASGTEWTVLRPPYLTDKPATGRYRTAVDASVPGGSLPRGDLARAMLDMLAEAATVRAALGVGPGGR
ncbi:NAD(P)-dependent oxidoreductase [Saccharomonospora cyanea]|uniref:Putative NADH-flavin reductase n=1 Tax=Saccharomonospora cyanea NA-134 TaxID=882082 RepID=H5XD73_9PSEU|nr:NAD(P)H-binding protein [Saccharomonospora cyanea]EHR59153.1 putative NADH-flavin reductase [Saccharomonospora cyanea NA-134]